VQDPNPQFGHILWPQLVDAPFCVCQGLVRSFPSNGTVTRFWHGPMRPAKGRASYQQIVVRTCICTKGYGESDPPDGLSGFGTRCFLGPCCDLDAS
jgi:hypothetical protein